MFSRGWGAACKKLIHIYITNITNNKKKQFLRPAVFSG
jgi:hypothetical protein